MNEPPLDPQILIRWGMNPDDWRQVNAAWKRIGESLQELKKYESFQNFEESERWRGIYSERVQQYFKLIEELRTEYAQPNRSEE